MNFPPTYLQLFLIVGLPLMGLVYAFLGGIKLPLAERLKLDEGKVGGLVAGFGMMVGPTILACGFLTDEFGRRWVFLSGAALVVVALLLLAAARSYVAALVAVLLLGAGWSATINVANVLMQVAAEPGKLTQAMQFGDFLFGFGAFITPMLLGVLLARVGYTAGVGLLAIVSAVPIAMGWFAPMDPPAAEAVAGAVVPTAGLAELFSQRLFWLTSLAFLFYVPLESSTAGWATTIVTQGSDDPAASRLASISLMGFWLCFTGSRLLVAVLGIEAERDQLLLGLTVASTAVVLGIVFVPGRTAAAVMVIAAGLIFGPIFPILISKILGAAPMGVEGRAVGFFFAFGSAGWTFIPALIGRVAKKSGIRRGFLVAFGSSVLFLGFVLLERFMH